MPETTPVETVAVDVIARTEQFDGKTKQSADDFGKSMNRIKASADDAEKAINNSTAKAGGSLHRMSLASNNTRIGMLEMQHVVKGAADQFAAGTPLTQIFAQHISQVGQAASFSGASLGKIGAFLAGPWGLAVTSAIAIAATLISKHLQLGNVIDDEVTKLKKHAEQVRASAQAEEIFKVTLEGLTAAIEENHRVLVELGKAQDTEAEKALKNADAQREQAIAIRESTIAQIEAAKATLHRLETTAPPLDAQAGQQGSQISAEAARLEQLQKELDKANADLAKVQADANDARTQVLVERLKGGPEAAIKKKYDDQINSARNLAVVLENGADILFKTEKAKAAYIEQTNAALVKQVTAIEAARRAEIKAYQESQRVSNTQAGREVTPQEAATIARAAGLQVNSISRTFAEQKKLYDAWIKAGKPSANPVAAPGTSAHEGAKGRWALDIQLADGVTPALLRKVFAAQGISLSKVLKEKGHFHIEGSRSQADTAQAAADQAAADEQKRQQAFENERAKLQEKELAAYGSLINNDDVLDKIKLAAIDLAKKAYDDNVDSQVVLGKLTEDEGKQLKALNDAYAGLSKEVVQRAEDERHFREREAANSRAAEFASAGRSDQEAILQGQEALARTIKERGQIEARLIELQYAEERARNDYVIAYYERLKTQKGIAQSELDEAAAQAKIAELKNSSIDQRQSNALVQSSQANANPLQSSLEKIPQTGEEINQAFNQIAADGLTNLTDGIADAIVNFKSLGDVGLAALQSLTKEVIKLALQQIILHTIGKALGVSAVAATTGEATAAASAWAPAAALASLATLGANAGPAAAALAGTTALAQGLALTGLAEGGPVFGPGGPTSDRVLMRASNGEYVIRASSARRLGRGVLDRLNTTGSLPVAAHALGGPIGPLTPDNRPASRASGGGGTSELSASSVRQLEGIVHSAMRAMPDVKLFPTLDPRSVMKAALAHPGAQRDFFEFVSNNSGQFKSNLGL